MVDHLNTGKGYAPLRIGGVVRVDPLQSPLGLLLHCRNLRSKISKKFISKSAKKLNTLVVI